MPHEVEGGQEILVGLLNEGVIRNPTKKSVVGKSVAQIG